MFQQKIFSQYTSSKELFTQVQLREGQTSSLYSPRNRTINSTPIEIKLHSKKMSFPGLAKTDRPKLQTQEVVSSSQDGFSLNKSKFKLKDILFSHKDEIKNLPVSQMTPQQKTQMNRMQKNEHLFTQLSDTLNTRKLTFAKFAFKFTEIDEDYYMKPILKGLYEREPQGTMLVSELWTKEQMRQYLGTADLSQSKRVLRRFAHWEWDQNSRSTKLQSITDTIKVDIFSRKQEHQVKLKYQGSHGDKRLKKEIRRRWMEDDVDIHSSVKEFGELFVICLFVLRGTVQKMQTRTVTNKTVNMNSYQKKLPRQSACIMIRDGNKLNQEQVNNLKDIIINLNDLHEENAKDHNNLKQTLTKLQTTIMKKEKQKNYQKQIPFGQEE